MTEASARPILVTDSSCDLPARMIGELGLELVSFRFTMDGREYVDDLGMTMSHADFYGRMRAGAHPTTAAVPMADYLEVFTRCAESGRPAILLGLTSHLSSSYEAALAAAKMVRESHPGADIRTPETLNASGTLGFLVLEAAERIAAGAGIDELEAWVLQERCRINGYFTVDTLEHLRRGGRIPDIVAYAGTMLDVRPILRIDGKGALVLVGQARGRRKSIKALADVAVQRAEEPGAHRAFIAHGDALEDAEALRALVLERLPFAETTIIELGPVMAAHAGPGMLAVVFWGKAR